MRIWELWRASAGAVLGTAIATTAMLFPSPSPIPDDRPLAPHKTAPPRVHPVRRTAAISVTPKPRPAPSTFGDEQRMSLSQRMKRWDPLVAAAAHRFAVPKTWLYAVMQLESGGYTMLSESEPIVSSAGAMGLMQIMPQTYADMRRQYGLGSDPFDPRDNILAAAAYLHWLHGKYGFPEMFAAYNDGPGNLEARMRDAGLLPAETRNYLIRISAKLSPNGIADPRFAALIHRPQNMVEFTNPDGSVLWIDINAASAISVRAAQPGEFSPGIHSVVTVGAVKHGVWETVIVAESLITSHGGTLQGSGML